MRCGWGDCASFCACTTDASAGFSPSLCVSVCQSFLGGEVEVPTLQEPIKLTVPPGTSPDTVKILKGKVRWADQ